jgi:transcriptional regulator with XRE-family HTH domain
LNGGSLHTGRTERRRIYIKAENIVLIGKESNEYEEEIEGSHSAELIANYGSLPIVAEGPPNTVAAMAHRHGFQNLADQAGISRQTISAAAHGKIQISTKTRRKIQQAARMLEKENQLDAAAILAGARTVIEGGEFTLRELARHLNEDPSNLSKVLHGKRKAPWSLLLKLQAILGGGSF